MILAVADILEKRGYNPSEHMLVQAIDISPLCYHMTYVQLALRGIPAAVIRGNSLSMEQFESAWTPETAPFYQKHGRLFDAPTPSAVKDSDPKKETQQHILINKIGQLGLDLR